MLTPGGEVNGRRVAGIALFLGVFLLYHFSFSSLPTADGSWYVSNIERGDYGGMLRSHSPLSGYFFFSLQRLLSSLGLSVGTLALIQTVNAAAAALGVVLFYGTIQLLGGGPFLGILGGSLLATSFGFWYFANGEFQHLSLGVLLLIFYLLLRVRVGGTPYGYRFVVGLAALNALAVLFRQENFLFGLAAVALLVIGRPLRQGLKEGLLYAVAGSVWTAVLVLMVGVFLQGASTPKEFMRWYFWLFDYVGSPQEYRSFLSAGFPFLSAVKGQLTALVFGTQVVADAVRGPALFGHPKVVYLAGLTIFVYGAIGFLLVDLWRGRSLLRDRCLIPLVACAVWLISYKVLIHSWFWPTSTKYHVVTLPPLVLLLLLGPIAARADAGSLVRRRTLQAGTVAILVAGVFVSNFWGGILPWYHYGRMKEALAARQQTTFRPDDFFISSESGIDGIFHKDGNHLSVKSLFKHASKEEGFEVIRSSIREQLANGRRVFLYNFVPSPFTLIGINQFARGGDPFRPRNFEEFLAELRKRYVLTRVLDYWEEGKEPLYLYGTRLETVWEIRRGQGG